MEIEYCLVVLFRCECAEEPPAAHPPTMTKPATMTKPVWVLVQAEAVAGRQNLGR